jgi:hypothetical protein
MNIGNKTGLNGEELVHHSKLVAKIDNTAIQDGYQIYLHTFILSKKGGWAVVQQGMNTQTGYARRYHWHSARIRSFVEEPHTAICGISEGDILNLTDLNADKTRDSVLGIAREHPERIARELRHIRMPPHHDIRNTNVNLKRLGSVLGLTHTRQPNNFESLLLTEGLGPRTLQSLVLISEIIFGTPSRFRDPARFSFAHGGKDGHPFPVPTKIYDESIRILRQSVDKAKIGIHDKQKALKKLHRLTLNIEKSFEPTTDLSPIVKYEKKNSIRWGGRTVSEATWKRKKYDSSQLSLF